MTVYDGCPFYYFLYGMDEIPCATENIRYAVNFIEEKGKMAFVQEIISEEDREKFKLN